MLLNLYISLKDNIAQIRCDLVEFEGKEIVPDVSTLTM